MNGFQYNYGYPMNYGYQMSYGGQYRYPTSYGYDGSYSNSKNNGKEVYKNDDLGITIRKIGNKYKVLKNGDLVIEFSEDKKGYIFYNEADGYYIDRVNHNFRFTDYGYGPRQGSVTEFY